MPGKDSLAVPRTAHFLVIDKRYATMRFVVYQVGCNSFYLSMCPVGAGATDRHEILHHGICVSRMSSLLSGTPKAPRNPKF